MIGFGGKEQELKPLSCLAGATGGTFAAAANAEALKEVLAKVFDAVLSPPPAPAQTAATGGDGAARRRRPARCRPASSRHATDRSRCGRGSTASVAQRNRAAAQLKRPQLSPRRAASQAPAPQPAPQASETAVHKSASPPPDRGARSISACRRRSRRRPTAPKPPAQTTARKFSFPVPVTFKALVAEAGTAPAIGAHLARLRVEDFAGGAGYKLVSTHRDPMPTAALLPGEYLVNAAYGLSNLTKKIKVESGRSIEETFVLNTGGLKLAALLPDGEPLPESAARYDILSDEEDQFGNRQMVLRDAKPGIVIRLNAGAYRIECLYGDANATVRADITVEPGKVTEATLKQTGAKTTFKLVQTLGGEALADTKWTILTSAGDVVKENAGALPTHILAPGSYAVVADHAGESFTRKFSIEPGEAKQIEVVVEDGPTSAEELKALTDPPEAAPAARGRHGVIAGDGRRLRRTQARPSTASRRTSRPTQCAADQSGHPAPRRPLALAPS